MGHWTRGKKKLEQNRPNWNNWGDNEKALIDINRIWIFDISKMNNKMFTAERGVVWFRKAHITLSWPDRHWSWVTTLSTSQISFSCPFNSVFPAHISFYTQSKSCWTLLEYESGYCSTLIKLKGLSMNIRLWITSPTTN